MYQTLIDQLFNLNFFSGKKQGLENALQLQKILNFPDKSYHIIHVAGTNGKGSVCTKIASALQHAGYTVGLYTSPHLSCFRERIRVNGEKISEAEVETYLSFLFELAGREHIPATFFEMTTSLGLYYFAKKKVDVAILETGLGGSLDATNVVNPLLSIITSISLDHTDQLGNTLEAIALEKAGIIKEKKPVLIGPHVPRQPIQAIARQKESILYKIDQTFACYEEENCFIANEALRLLYPYFNLTRKAIEKGLESRPPCRFEVLENSIILDVAHNPAGIERLLEMIKLKYPGYPLQFLIGFSKNKDIHTCLKLLAPIGQHFHLVKATGERAASPQELSTILESLAVPLSHISIYSSIEEGTKSARDQSFKQNHLLVICGTFFIMKDVRQTLEV